MFILIVVGRLSWVAVIDRKSAHSGFHSHAPYAANAQRGVNSTIDTRGIVRPLQIRCKARCFNFM